MNRRAASSGPRQGLDEKFSGTFTSPIRRGFFGLPTRVMIAAAVMAFTVFGPTQALATAPSDETPTTVTIVDTSTPVDTRPPITDNGFLPENQDLTVCVGALERPGCGSEDRGGWHQWATFAVVIAGLVIVFGSVIRSTRRRYVKSEDAQR